MAGLPQPNKKKTVSATSTEAADKEVKFPSTVGKAKPAKVHTNSVDIEGEAMIDVEAELTAPITDKSILVVATDKGYYGHLRREPGDKFYIENEEHLGSWMQPLDGKVKAKKKINHTDF